MRYLIGFLFLFMSGTSAVANEEPAAYGEALSFMQQKKYIQAMEKFEESFSEDPTGVSALYNWGLAAYEVEQPGLAIALWRRALYQSPNFGPAAAALGFAKEKLSHSLFSPPGAGSLENFKSEYLRVLSLSHILLLHFLLFIFTAWLTLRYFTRRKEALELEDEPPRVSAIHISFAALLIVCSVLLVLALDFRFEARATVIAQQASLKTIPQKEANDIFKLIEGSEVLIDDVENDWTLVSYPGGMTGWVHQSELFQNHGSRLW